MIISKIKVFFKSFRNKVIVIIALLVVTAVLFVSKYVLKSETTGDKNTINTTTDADDEKIPGKPDIEHLKAALSPGIDSVLRNFGIKAE